jgi:hypothetical protein
MNKFFILFAFGFTSLFYGQQPAIKTYPATPTWDFICENYALTGIAKVQIARNEKGGTLQLEVTVTDTTYAIAGNVYIFLTDNTIITCTDKKLRSVKDHNIISDYYFSAIEMNKLKTTEIQSIHFNITGKTNNFSSQIGNFTAVNRKNYFSTAFDKSKKSYNTATEIEQLYK